MTKLLNEAFARAAELDDEEQDAFARWLLNELKDERRWKELLSSEPDALAALADEALEEHRRGETELLDPTRL
jgi:hypothetical protein